MQFTASYNSATPGGTFHGMVLQHCTLSPGIMNTGAGPTPLLSLVGCSQQNTLGPLCGGTQ